MLGYFLSTDLNGTLVHSDTALDMIQMGFPQATERHKAAHRAFSLQSEGKLSMEETFRIAGEQTRGLPLKSAIVAFNRMRFVDGYAEFIDYLKQHQISTGIVTTGYSVTLYAMQYSHPENDFIFGCNRLVFASRDSTEISEVDLKRSVRLYFKNPDMQNDNFFRTACATGKVILGIKEEGDKARIALTVAQGLGIPPSRTMHMGDTMGDSLGILAVAKAGGLGIAFNYNHSLEEFLRSEAKREIDAGHIAFIDPKGSQSDLRNVIAHIETFRRR